jgi:sec-independent protein translocase protein TatC
VTPLAVNFLGNYQVADSILNEFDIISYVSTVATLVLVCGLMFQLPMVVLFLTKAGLVTPELMRTYRKHAIVVILVASAILTPPDVVSQVLIAFPLVFLYQISIFISKMVIRNQEKSEALEKEKT